MRDPDYSPELQGRLGKLEGAISKQRTVKFRYWSIYRDEEEERTLNPYALLPENGSWYVIGHDLERDDIRTFRVSRIRSDIRFATRRERDFRLPPEFDVENYRGRADWQFGDIVGEAQRSRSRPTPPGGSSAPTAASATSVEGDVFTTRVRVVEPARPLDPPPGRPRDPARAVGAAPADASRARAPRARRTRAPRPRRPAFVQEGEAESAPSGLPGRSRPSASACCSRCSPTC